MLKPINVVFFILVLTLVPFSNFDTAEGETFDYGPNIVPSQFCGIQQFTGSSTMNNMLFGRVSDPLVIKIEPTPATNNPADILVTATDWTSPAVQAIGIIEPSGIRTEFVSGDTVTLNSITYSAKLSSEDQGDQNFEINDYKTTLQNLVNAINQIDTQVVASLHGDVVLITAAQAGLAGNNIGLATSTSNLLHLPQPSLTGGADSIIQMLSSVTKYEVDPTGGDITSTQSNIDQYTGRTSLPAIGESLLLGSFNLDFKRQFSGISMALQVLVDGSTLSNVAYEGPLRQTLTFTVSCPDP